MVTAAHRSAPARSATGAVAALCLVQFVDVLGVTVVVTALPAMLDGVHARPADGSLVATGYAMFFGGLLMFGARLGDRLGHRRVILASVAVFALGAVLAAAAGSIVVLTGARCVQGAAAAAAVPSALRLLTSVAGDPTRRARAVAAWSASGAAAGASGFVVGGVVSDLASWRAVFWGLLPVAALLAAGVARFVPADEGRVGARRPLNAPSSLLLTAAVMAVVVGATEVAEPGRRVAGAVLLAAAAVLAGALRRVDRRSATPLLPRAVLRRPTLRRGAVGGFLNTATTSSTAALVTLYLQGTLGRSPLAAAGTLLPFSLLVVLGSALATPLLARWVPERVCAAGLAVIALACAALVVAAPGAWAVATCMAGAGLGIGLSSVAATSLGTDVPEDDRGTASGLINTTAQLGTAIGVAAVLLVAAATTGVPARGTGAPAPGWWAAAAVAAAGALGFAALRVGGAVRRSAAAAAAAP